MTSAPSTLPRSASSTTCRCRSTGSRQRSWRDASRTEPSMRIAVCRPQVPFAHGGAEIFSDTLVDELRARGHEAEIVSVQFKWYPGASVLTQAFTWRLLDMTEA